MTLLTIHPDGEKHFGHVNHLQGLLPHIHLPLFSGRCTFFACDRHCNIMVALCWLPSVAQEVNVLSQETSALILLFVSKPS